MESILLIHRMSNQLVTKCNNFYIDMMCPQPMCNPIDNCIENVMKTDENGCKTCECEELCPVGMVSTRKMYFC